MPRGRLTIEAFSGLETELATATVDLSGKTSAQVELPLKSFSRVAGARQLASELCETADRALQPFGRRADRLRELSVFVASRSL